MTTSDRPPAPADFNVPDPLYNKRRHCLRCRPAAVRLVAWQLAVGPVRVGWRRVEVRGRAA